MSIELQVVAEGMSFVYIDDPLLVGENQSHIETETLGTSEIQQRMFATERVRVGVFSFAPLIDRLAYYLCWPDNTDIANIDTRVREDRYADEDFVSALRCRYQFTSCDSCKKRWHTLIIPPDPYLGRPELMQKKMRIAQPLRCPNCSGFFRQLVVLVLSDDG